MLASRVQRLTPHGIDRAFAAAQADPEVLKLHHFETDLAPPEEALRVTRERLGGHEANSYLPTRGTAELRDAIAAHLRRRLGVAYDPEHEIVVTAGGLEGVFDVLLTTVDEHADVIVPDPTFTGLLNRIRLAGAVPRHLPFVVADGEWRLDVERLEEAITARTRAVLIANPSMPTGAVLDDEEWSAIARVCREHDLWLIYDAAMEAIVYDGRPRLHPLQYDGMRERTFVVGSLSKEFRMVGWRIGWVAGPEQSMESLHRVVANVGSGAPAIAQAAGAAVLSQSDDADLQRALAEWTVRRDAIAEQLAEFGVVPAAGGWSCALDVSQFGLDAGAAVKLLMGRSKIAATSLKLSGETYGATLVRFAFGCEPVDRLGRVGSGVRAALAG